MRRLSFVMLCHISVFSLISCSGGGGGGDDDASPIPNDRLAALEPGEGLSGGQTSVIDNTLNAFSKPVSNLDIIKRTTFEIGDSFFTRPWVSSPASTTARDGLGPIHNANSCQSCHVRDGRGQPPEFNQMPISMLVRASIPNELATTPAELDSIATIGVLPEPNYGGQVQFRSVAGVSPEPTPIITYETITGTFADGEVYELRKPSMSFPAGANGAFHADARFSARVAPIMPGLGLLENIPEADIRALADPDDSNGDGISGRPNEVWDRTTEQLALGRFGWKAGQPSVRQQSAAAFAGDIGITNPLFSDQPCSPTQTDCLAAPNGNGPDVVNEVGGDIFEAVIFYSKTLGIPVRRDPGNETVLRGKKLFTEAQCSSCHIPKWKTGIDSDIPELSEQDIRPYTDLLLHDMGEGLADNRTEFQASGREWRTPPLWGIGLIEVVNGHSFFLHDGRARSLKEAILWHGGEAATAKAHFIAMEKSDRDALITFLNSL